MSLTISLDSQLTQYSGNETICGRVNLQCFKPIEIEEVKLTFSGLAEAKVQKTKGSAAPSVGYRSKCVLFEKDRILAHQGGQQMAIGSYSWPFELTFPSHVQPEIKPSKWPVIPPFRNDANHPLPPTFSIETSDSLRRLVCSIGYHIHAQVFKPSSGFMGKPSPFISEVLALQFIPPINKADMVDVENFSHMSYHQQEHVFSIQSMHLLQEYKGRSLGVQEKLRSWFSPRQLPRFNFSVSFSYPTRAAQSTPLHCNLTVAPRMEDSSVSSPPVILMQSLHITLVSRTYARSGPSLMGSMSGEVDERMEILSRTSLNMAMSGMIDLTETFGPLVFRPIDVSFGTFNISRMYRLCVSGQFECAGKMSKFQALDLPIDIIPRSQRNATVSQGPEPPIDDNLPSYTPFSLPPEMAGVPQDAKKHDSGNF
ncbi:hypothetical protein N7478_005365 [Penicillium angulare]|uniref:uncharacterized protein n=1 Tax=Penicillium angulare TaxID=116970 RepID=UPI00253FCB2A|nr:uncharacterized protein N7478_005365 [Penicillium angulare]KAJ5279993.1 hypothetical protein N7478_005365 [Penicillium angulare]